MSLYDYMSPREPEYSDDEWDFARFQVCSELIRDGYTRDDAERMADDWTIAEQAAFNRDRPREEWVDRQIKARKEEGL